MINLERIIYKDVTRNGLYYTILDNKIYYQDHFNNINYVFCDGKRKRILKGSCAVHNFTPFLASGKYFAIGGMDDWKKDPKWRGLGYEEFKKVFTDHFGKEYIRDSKFYYDKVVVRFNNDPIWRHNRGLYLFESLDGINWIQKAKDPIITVNNPGYISSLKWKSAEFDGRPDIIFFKNKYYIYMRANVARGVRRVQYTTTTDFKTFSDFQLIENYSRDNDYFLTGFTYNEKLFAFIPGFSMRESYVDLYMSDNGHDFIKIERYFENLPYYNPEGRPKNKTHSCSGFWQNEQKIYVYFHYNYMGYDSSHDVGILEYSIKKEDLCKA